MSIFIKYFSLVNPILSLHAVMIHFYFLLSRNTETHSIVAVIDEPNFQNNLTSAGIHCGK